MKLGQIKYYTLLGLRTVLGRRLVEALLLRRNRHYYRKTGIVFIHIPKNAGTSISRLIYGRSLGHRTAQELLRFDSRILSGRPSFAILRDPVERAMSAWRYCLTGGSEEGFLLDSPDYKLPEFQTFERFATEWLAARDPSTLDFVLRPQSDFVCNQDGALLVDHLLPLTDLSAGLKKILGGKVAQTDIPVRNRNRRQSKVAATVSPEAIAALRTVYAADFKLYESLGASGD